MRWVAVALSLVAAGCASPFGGERVSYCDAARTLQHRYADARAMEGDDSSASVVADGFNQVELQSEVVRDAAPDEVRDDWAAVARPGNAAEAAARAFEHADAQCATALRAIEDGLPPAEAKKYGSAGAEEGPAAP